MFAYQRSFVLEQKPFERDKRRATRAGRGREERIKNKAFIPDSLFAADSKRDAPSLVAIRRSAISINLRIC